VRTFGNDTDVVIENALEYMRAAKENNIAVSIKHFPGDGVDERDQHILTSVNSLSIKEWDKTFGKVYKRLIDADALTVMAGHIAMPAYQEYFNPSAKRKMIPATLSKELLNNLLREKLGFNGLIVTDATPMVGFTSAMEREKSIPYAIECGCDMILFNKDLDEDFEFMRRGIETGILSKKRLADANRRTLATKATLKLHINQKNMQLIPSKKELKILKNKQHIDWAYELADQAITLVKDTQSLLPITPDKQKRILLQVIGDFPSNERVMKVLKSELENRKFDVIVYEPEDFSKGVDNVTDIKNKYDLVFYIGNIENASNKTTNRLNWYTFFGQGNNIPWFVKEVPTLFASIGNPYHLFDVPMMETYINGYANNDYVLEMLIKKVVGESKFKGKNPINPFCGREDLAY
ncbi:MAG TPA: glycoside hydrolase family 3 protein, partial [Epulopiscium sp.]|nr:glycoside hydrolase family 3 protein [Candidatus Epulonipiscium sp.]